MAEMSSTVHIMPTQDGRDVVYCAYSAREPNQAVWRTTCEPLDAGLPPKKLLCAALQCKYDLRGVTKSYILFKDERAVVVLGAPSPSVPVFL